jgi:GT2 family glycosyltransferase
MSMIASPQRRPTRPLAAADEDRLPSVLAIVVTHNGRDWLRESLIGLANQSYQAVDVLVVDDASLGRREKPTLKRLAKRHLRQRRWGYLRTPRPLGFGGAINWALARIRTDADLLLFVHDDAALDRRSVEHMVTRLGSDADTAIVGPKIVSWDNPARLEEVGMAADRFGYPYKGLEDGEIDLGQHDRASEVFYVTSTCMLVRHSVFRDLRGWDARMRAFAEDLDLCWRARLAGHTVQVEPLAKARHAIALAEGLRRSPFGPARYYIRRNRLRTITKNASGVRLLVLVPQFVLLTFVEMLGFIILRQPRELLHLARALLWNVIRLPQTLAERARVQRRRTIPDRRLRTLTVRETTRIRSYAGNQAQRIEQAWGRRTDVVARRNAQLRALAQRLAGLQGVAAAIVLVAVVLGFRHVLWGPPVSIGELLPFPERPTGLLRTFLSPWQSTGLGYPGPAPAGLAILGVVPVVTLGATGLAQKLLIVALGAIASLGAYRLVAPAVDRPGRVAAGLVYALGSVGLAGVREARLGALIFGAAAPFVLGAMLRLIGWARPPGFHRSNAIAQLALGTAVSAAFIPGALILYLIAGVMLAVTRAALERGGRALQGFSSMSVGLIAGWALLLPWSASWWAAGGPFSRLSADTTWKEFASGFADHGALSVLLGQTPAGVPLFGLALPLLGLVAVFVGEGVRRRLGLALWTVIAAVGFLVSLMASGVLRPIVASPTEAGVLPALAFAGLAGVAVGAFRLDLPRRGLGWIHAATIAALALSAFLVAVGIAPSLWNGGWDPGVDAGGDPVVVQQITSLLGSEAEERGSFRALWVGESWSPAEPSALKPLGRHLLTGPRGENLGDLYARDVGLGYDALDDAVAAIESGSTDLGGRLLGAFNVDFVIVAPAPGASRWLGQRDLALIRSEDDYLVLRNEAALPRAGVFHGIPAAVNAIDAGNAELIAGDVETSTSNIEQSTAHVYEAGGARGPGVAWLAETSDPLWEAELGDRVLPQQSAGWGNAFRLPDAAGKLDIAYPRTRPYVLWLIAFAIAWTVVIGAAFSRARVRQAPTGSRS